MVREADPPLLELAAAALAAWRERGLAPRDAIAAELPRGLPAERRAELARVVYGAVRDERRLEHAFAAQPGWQDLDAAARDVALLLAFRVGAGAMSPRGAELRLRQLTGAGLSFLPLAALDDRIDAIADAGRRFAVRHSLPDWLGERLRAGFGAEAEAVAAGLRAEPPRTIRANRLSVTSRGALARELAEAGVGTALGSYAPDALHVVGDQDLFRLAAYEAGRFEQQDEGSQLIALLCAPPPRGKVLDACAGSGGKALALAALLQGRGAVLATDPHRGRLAALQRRAARAHAFNVRALPVAEDRWPAEVERFAAAADRILLDVPCSGVGSFRRRPEARWQLQPHEPARLVAVQRGLLDRAAALLRPGARLIYATCTLLAEENEQQIEAALQRHPHLQLVRAREILGRALADPVTDPTGTFLDLRPDRHGCDGFFAAVLRSRGP